MLTAVQRLFPHWFFLHIFFHCLNQWRELGTPGSKYISVTRHLVWEGWITLWRCFSLLIAQVALKCFFIPGNLYTISSGKVNLPFTSFHHGEPHVPPPHSMQISCFHTHSPLFQLMKQGYTPRMKNFWMLILFQYPWKQHLRFWYICIFLWRTWYFLILYIKKSSRYSETKWFVHLVWQSTDRYFQTKLQLFSCSKSTIFSFIAYGDKSMIMALFSSLLKPKASFLQLQQKV